METQNFLLSLLDEELREEVLRVARPVKLALGDTLVNAGAPIKHVFFLSSGIASVLVVSRSGRKMESGIVGKEGFVPTNALSGVETCLNEIIIQAPGDALSIDIHSFRSFIAKYRIFSEIMTCALHVAKTQVEYTASSNATQTVSQRLARWLLMCDDRVKSDHLHLTHDFLSVMLAVRRPSVTDALHELESQGFIRAERAKITIRNRKALAVYAGDFYGLPEEEELRVFARFRKSREDVMQKTTLCLPSVDSV